VKKKVSLQEKFEMAKIAIGDAKRQENLYAAAKVGLMLQFCRAVEFNLQLTKGKEILVHYDSGDECCRYEGYASTGHCVWVMLRFYTKKKEPRKQAVRENWDIMAHISNPSIKGGSN